MASRFLMTMQFKTQGKIKGSSAKHGGADGMECHAFNYEVIAPVDSSSGHATGKRQHKPVVITREVDSASPLLWQAMVTNEVFQRATLLFSRPGSGGKETVYQTIELTNGVISKIDWVPAVQGKRCHALTLVYEELAVNGAKNGVVPRSLLG